MHDSPKAVYTASDIITFIELDTSLEKAQRQQICSAVRRFCKVVGKAPAEVAADPGAIKALARSASPKRAGVAHRRWLNIVSDVRRALVLCGLHPERSRRQPPLDPEWQALMDKLVGHRELRDRLRSFMAWASGHGIHPEDVDQKTFQAYLGYQSEQTLNGDPRERTHVRRRAWNKAVESIPGWPPRPVESLDEVRYRSLPWETFPPSLLLEVRDYEKKALNGDLFGDTRPLRPASVRNHQHRLRLLATAVVEAGTKPEELGSLHVLLQPDNVKRGLTQMRDRLKNANWQASVSCTITAAVSVAKRVGLPDGELAELQAFGKKLRYQPGLTVKNKNGVDSVISDRETLRRFLSLPATVVAEIDRDKRTDQRATMTVAAAVAMEILLVAPMRLGNLVQLDLTRHVSWSGAGREGVASIHIPAHEVKNDVDLDFPLPEASSRLLRLYLDVYRPRLLQGECSALFVGRTGLPLGCQGLYRKIHVLVERHLGLRVYPHLFRHIAATLHLKFNPGDYETPRRMLGHKQISTTIQFYQCLEADDALKHYHRTILDLRDDEKETEL